MANQTTTYSLSPYTGPEADISGNYVLINPDTIDTSKNIISNKGSYELVKLNKSAKSLEKLCPNETPTETSDSDSELDDYVFIDISDTCPSQLRL